MKSREQDRLAAEARARANEAAYDGFNRKLLNRWKVVHLVASAAVVALIMASTVERAARLPCIEQATD